MELGAAEPLISVVARLTSDEELLGLVEYAPRHTGEVLVRLLGTLYQQVECKRARSLLFVSATRARDALTIVWHGKPSPLMGGVAATAATH
ncbi:hypothetical protein [Streptomyces sp. NPDC000618]|uniref:hypothetical protein n=1 Tax=Streptomyces sp. NPDC000618 TaxID=3154265 RepID=UPI00332E3AEE